MNKFIAIFAFLFIVTFSSAEAQIQRDNWLIGGNAAMDFTNGFSLDIKPQVGYFFRDRFAIGARLGADLDIVDAGDDNATSSEISIGPFARYYFGNSEYESVLRNGRVFVEVSTGFSFINQSLGESTNGINLGGGVGYSYFITNTIALEGLFSAAAVSGGGSQDFTGDFGIRVGFQIFLPSGRARAALEDTQR